MITLDEFQKADLRVGEILSAESVPNSAKLLKLSVNLGPTYFETSAGKEEHQDIRQVVSGIAKYFPEPSVLVGRKCMFVANLEPRMLMGLESQAMILAVSTEDGQFSLIMPDQGMPGGAKAK